MIKAIGVLLFLLFPFSIFGETDFFRSNQIGMLLEKIAWYQKDEHPYILERNRSPLEDILELHFEDKVIKTWNISYYDKKSKKNEKYFNQGVLESALVYDRSQRVKEEMLFLNGELNRRIIYYYRGKYSLDYTKTFDRSNNLLYQDFYFLTSRGGIREVKRIRSDQGFQKSSFMLVKGKYTREAHSGDKDHIISLFDDKGRLSGWELLRGGEVLIKRTFTYRGDEETPVSSREENLIDGNVYLQTYNDKGEMIKEEVEKEGAETSSQVYTLDEKGRKIEVRKRGDQGVELWKYIYSDDDSLVSEEYYRKGSIEKKIFYQEEGFYEELFREVEPFIRVYYKNDKKYKEEVLYNGEVIKTREFNEQYQEN